MSRNPQESEYERLLVDEVRSGRLTRRQLVERATVLGLSLPAIGALLAACGGGDDEGEAAAAGEPAPAEPAPAEPAPAEPAPSAESPSRSASSTSARPATRAGRSSTTRRASSSRRTSTNVETTFLDNVPEANAGPAIDQLISQGNKLIFATSFGYGDTVIQKAQREPGRPVRARHRLPARRQRLDLLRPALGALVPDRGDRRPDDDVEQARLRRLVPDPGGDPGRELVHARAPRA